MELSFLASPLTFFSSSFFFLFIFTFFVKKGERGRSNLIFAETGLGYDGSLSPSLKLETHVGARRPSCRRSRTARLPPAARPRPHLRAGNGTHWTPREDGGAALPPTTPLALLAAPMRLGLAWLSPAAGVTAQVTERVAFPSRGLVGQRTPSHTLALTEGGDAGPETLLQGHPVLPWMEKGRLA